MNTIKQFALLLSNFVDKTFLPLLDSKTFETIKVIDQWNGLKSLLLDQEPI